MTDVDTPMTEGEVRVFLRFGHAPRPAAVPSGWVQVSARLERMFTNGRQTIEPNEVGDVSGYDSRGERPAQRLRGVIQEAGDVPVEIVLTGDKYTEPVPGVINTIGEVECLTPNKDGRYPSYTIVGNVATKTKEREP